MTKTSVPLPVKNVLAVLSVATVVALLTLSLLPKDQFGFSSLLFGVVGYGAAGFNDGPLQAALPMAQPPADPPASVLIDFPTDSPSDSVPASSVTVDAPPEATSLPPPDVTSLPPSEAARGPPPAAPDLLLPKEEKFLFPMLSPGVGAGNQLMEYVSAAVIARATNRTLCLPPFFSGPGKHNGLSVSGKGGLNLETRYNVSSLARFTRLASLEHCQEQCDYTLHRTVLLRSVRDEPLLRGWKKFQFNNESLNLQWNYLKWQSTKDANATLGALDHRCVGVGGMFPGLRWRGAFLGVSAFLQPALPIFEAANILQTLGIGKDAPYLAVHWRFEESRCPKHQIGLCFSRCLDGSVIDTGLIPVAKEWLKASEIKCGGDGHFLGVGLSKLDIVATVEDRIAKHNLTSVYMATDGWIRGPEGLALVNEVVLMLRSRGVTVIGLWSIPGLPNFADGSYFDPYKTLGTHHVINGQQIALVEQEICVRAAVFLGSGQSTWSLAVFRLRLAKRRAAEILATTPEAGRMDGKGRDELVSETLLKDQHRAGMQCYYSRFLRHTVLNETVETYADEYPDGWLDLDACEGRIGRGGHCEVAKCF